MRLALGTAQFGLSYGVANQAGQVTRQEAAAILQLAKDNGIDTLDTAIAYGDSEQRLGEIGIQGWQIVSKLPAIPDECADVWPWVTSAVDESLKRLNVQSLYGLLLHRPQQLMGKSGDGLYRVLQHLKQRGLVQKIGISIYDPSELDVLCDRFEFDLVQAPFNVLDRRLIDSGWLRRLRDQSIELHVRSVFLQGLLLMTRSSRPAKFDRWNGLWNDWEEWLAAVNLKPTEACILYALSFPEISRIIVGVDACQQLAELIDAAYGIAPEMPSTLKSNDMELLNPARWSTLT